VDLVVAVEVSIVHLQEPLVINIHQDLRLILVQLLIKVILEELGVLIHPVPVVAAVLVVLVVIYLEPRVVLEELEFKY
tara:strand:- start:262 stop:495 length:234 start_codon:yes stop_codon:yes gene_type:complete